MRRVYGLLTALACLAAAGVCLYAVWRYWGIIPGGYRYPDGHAATRRAEIVQGQQWAVLAWGSGIVSVLLFVITGFFVADDHDQEVAHRKVRAYRADSERIRARAYADWLDRLDVPDDRQAAESGPAPTLEPEPEPERDAT